MTRKGVLTLVCALTAFPALADVAFDDDACAEAQAGARCRTADDRVGTCTLVNGELRCVSNQSSRSLLPLFGLALSALAFLAATWLRRLRDLRAPLHHPRPWRKTGVLTKG